jgi:hypothetical protein
VLFDPKVFDAVKVIVCEPGMLKQTGPGFGPEKLLGVPPEKVQVQL